MYLRSSAILWFVTGRSITFQVTFELCQPYVSSGVNIFPFVKFFLKESERLIQSQFGFHSFDLIDQRLFPGKVGVPFSAKKYIAGIDMLEVEFIDWCV